jgi:hypothetical protein
MTALFLLRVYGTLSISITEAGALIGISLSDIFFSKSVEFLPRSSHHIFDQLPTWEGSLLEKHFWEKYALWLTSLISFPHLYYIIFLLPVFVGIKLMSIQDRPNKMFPFYPFWILLFSVIYFERQAKMSAKSVKTNRLLMLSSTQTPFF